MNSQFIVAAGSEIWLDDKVDTAALLEQGLLKTLSLVVSSRALVPVPPSLLMLDKRMDVVESWGYEKGLPLMIRMDFARLPKRKTLGGIPLYSMQAIDSVSTFLLAGACYPLFHPHLDRFEDIYSVGVLLNQADREAHVEVVGKGFDAGDLRLGVATPHETLKIRLPEGRIGERRLMADVAYAQARTARMTRIRRFQTYIQYANRTGTLLSSLENLDSELEDFEALRVVDVPRCYTPMPAPILGELSTIVSRIRSDVLESLPPSEMFVASLSFLPEDGWVLWDVFGGWYRR